MHPYNPQCPIVTACCQLMWIYCRRSPNHTVNMVYMGHTAKTTLACITRRRIECSNTHSEPIISSRRHSVNETAEWIKIWPHSKPIARYLLLRQSRQIIKKTKLADNTDLPSPFAGQNATAVTGWEAWITATAVHRSFFWAHIFTDLSRDAVAKISPSADHAQSQMIRPWAFAAAVGLNAVEFGIKNGPILTSRILTAFFQYE